MSPPIARSSACSSRPSPRPWQTMAGWIATCRCPTRAAQAESRKSKPCAAVARMTRACPALVSAMTNIASMTGFAESAGSHDGLRWRWEAKSVNGRSLDLRLRTPPGFDGLEPPARQLAAERFQRGTFQISLTVEAAGSRARACDRCRGAGQRRQDRARGGGRDRPGAGAGGWASGAQGRDRGRTRRGALDPLVRGARDAAILESLAAGLRHAGQGALRRRRQAGPALLRRADRRDRAPDRRSGEPGGGAARRLARPAARRRSRNCWTAAASPKSGWRRKWRCWR